MSNELVTKENIDASIIEQVVIQGDLSKLTPVQRVTYYNKVCESVGLNPLTKPFDYIQLNGKLTLYAKKDATEQLRKVNGISITSMESQVIDDLYVVKVTAQDKTGRTDAATGAVTIGHLKGDAKANALMKAETKAKRRVTLSIAGMGWVDESEVETIPGAKNVTIDICTGEIEDKKPESEDKKPDRITISPQQLYDLNVMLMDCDKDFLETTIMSKLRPAPFNIESLDKLPISFFDRTRTIIQDHINKKNEVANAETN